MQVRVLKWGSDLAIRLPKAVVEALRLEEEQSVELVAEAGGIKLKVEGGTPRYRLEDLVAEMERLGPEHEPPSVDWGPDVGAEIIDDDFSRRG